MSDNVPLPAGVTSRQVGFGGRVSLDAASESPAADGSPRPVGAQCEPMAGFGVLLIFQLRRNAMRLVLWLAVVVGMVAFVGVYYAGLPKATMADFAVLSKTPTMASLVGLISNLEPLGAKVWVKLWMFIVMMLGIGMVFIVTRNLRGDEDAGRGELIRSRPLGIHANHAVVLIISLLLCVLCGAGSALVAIVIGMDASGTMGSWVFGVSIGAVGVLGVGIASLSNQVFPSSSAANGMGVGVFGLLYAIRMMGDLKYSWLVWVSPLGWAEKMDPWGDNRMWLLAPIAAVAAICVALGWAVETRRDYEGSPFTVRSGRAAAKRWQTSVVGLAVRLQRVSLVLCAIAVAIFAAMFGSITKSMVDMIGSSGLHIPTSSGAKTVVALLLCVMAVAISAFTVQSAQTMILDETHGLLEVQLAGGVSRIGWIVRRMAVTAVGTVLLLVVCGLCLGVSYAAAVSDFSQVWPVVGASAAYLPSLLIVLGVVVAGFGLWPRAAIAVSWVFMVIPWFLLIVGITLHLPDWVMRYFPFTSMESVPAADVNWKVMALQTAVGLALVVAGFIGFRRRDVPMR